MDPSVPRAAALLLDFVSMPESEGRYDAVFGNHHLPTPITAMTLDQLVAAQKGWGRVWGSSAAGRYQCMPATLQAVRKPLGLTGDELFTPDLQDRIGYQLLRQRGCEKFVARQTSIPQFGLALAQEWASLPVLAAVKGAHRMLGRGETYYAGDRLNRALVKPEAVEAVLAQALAAGIAPPKTVAPVPVVAAKTVAPAHPMAATAAHRTPLAEFENLILTALARH